MGCRIRINRSNDQIVYARISYRRRTDECQRQEHYFAEYTERIRMNFCSLFYFIFFFRSFFALSLSRSVICRLYSQRALYYYSTSIWCNLRSFIFILEAKLKINGRECPLATLTISTSTIVTLTVTVTVNVCTTYCSLSIYLSIYRYIATAVKSSDAFRQAKVIAKKSTEREKKINQN